MKSELVYEYNMHAPQEKPVYTLKVYKTDKGYSLEQNRYDNTYKWFGRCGALCTMYFKCTASLPEEITDLTMHRFEHYLTANFIPYRTVVKEL